MHQVCQVVIKCPLTAQYPHNQFCQQSTICSLKPVAGELLIQKLVCMLICLGNLLEQINNAMQDNNRQAEQMRNKADELGQVSGMLNQTLSSFRV